MIQHNNPDGPDSDPERRPSRDLRTLTDDPFCARERCLVPSYCSPGYGRFGNMLLDALAVVGQLTCWTPASRLPSPYIGGIVVDGPDRVQQRWQVNVADRLGRRTVAAMAATHFSPVELALDLEVVPSTFSFQEPQ